jgi:hypothetical protein
MISAPDHQRKSDDMSKSSFEPGPALKWCACTILIKLCLLAIAFNSWLLEASTDKEWATLLSHFCLWSLLSYRAYT